ncbi:MAG: DnaJ domain-containing protein, partial [Treponema sp.]|nr:DnaJ domain-containing protein [Treponema sp.]
NDGNHRVSGDSGSSGGRSSYRRVIYRRISPELEKAFSLLGLESTTDKDVVKKAYKEKLLSYHPDRYAGKDVMEKVANDKTREVVAAYRLIMDFLA